MPTNQNAVLGKPFGSTSQTAKAMQAVGYAEYTALRYYIDAYVPVIRFFEKNGKTEYDSETMAEFTRMIEERVECNDYGRVWYLKMKRGISQLVSFHDTGKIDWYWLRKASKFKLNDFYEGIFAEFLAKNEFHSNTIGDIVWVGRKYFEWLVMEGHDTLGGVGAEEIQRFMSYCFQHMKSNGIYNVKLYLKKLYAYLFQTDRAECSYHELLSFKVSRETKILPAVPAEELAKTLSMIKAVSNKHKVVDIGTGHTKPRPRDEWIVVPNAHEPLVSEADFQKAQLVLAKKKHDGQPEHIFGNKIKCPSCDHAMTRITKQNPRFKCGTAKLTDHYGCQTHSILQSEIEQVVLASIRAFAAHLIDREQMKLLWLEREKASAGELEAKIQKENKAIQLLESSVTKLFTSFVSGMMTKEVFLHKKGVVNETIARKRVAVEEITERVKALKAGRAAVDSTLSELTPLLAIETLDKEIVNLLITKILIHGAHDIEILWNGRYEA